MNRFELDILSSIPPFHNKVVFQKLINNGKCLYDEFCLQIQKNGNQRKDLTKIESIISMIAKGSRNPKFKELKGRKESEDPYKDYEIKVNQLRIFLFEDKEEGKIIVFGIVKKDTKKQNSAIEKMREIKKEYFEEKKSILENIEKEKRKIDLKDSKSEEISTEITDKKTF
ncbi:MAG: Unknown protein [uncultured Sulfurovum sp.]|uniref:Type II toxin-antitoxin system RelE/ParE family toxin n=1 Tax=uncultured Sulfurovum sp. TaxID=269237 RepID=A0A6S6TY39_9BACT|nr:MAG: Unknown protein [uncultured Sulfurovum sp.]